MRYGPIDHASVDCLPWGKPEAAAEELERAVNELGFVGTLLLGRPGDTFLDDPRYVPITPFSLVGLDSRPRKLFGPER